MTVRLSLLPITFVVLGASARLAVGANRPPT
jgi:hypothetical protein